jgi:magnesium transporter
MGKRSKKIGLAPGSLLYTGIHNSEKIKINIIDYDIENFREENIDKIEDCFPLKETPTVSWIDIKGLHDAEMIEKVGKQFEIHPLVLEDIVSTHQRPKTDIFDNYIYIVLKMLSYNESKKKIEQEQVSIIIGDRYVLTFQEKEGDVLEPLRERIRKSKGRIKSMGSDYLAYCIIDIIVDHYFSILENLSDEIAKLEEKILKNPQQHILNEIYFLKRENILLRKSIWPLREVISLIERSDNKLIENKTIPYLKDLYDHTIQVIDTLETFRDMIAGLVELYMTMASNKMNEVMKLLTIISTIFIPLTFIAGIYGMNFENMPELAWKFGYAGVMIIMALLAIFMVIFFRKKKWL